MPYRLTAALVSFAVFLGCAVAFAVLNGCASQPIPVAPYLAMTTGTSMGHGPKAIIVLRANYSTVTPGKSVVFYTRYPHPFRIVNHRTVRQLPDGSWITKGDANDRVDPWRMTEKNFIGIVVEG